VLLIGDDDKGVDRLLAVGNGIPNNRHSCESRNPEPLLSRARGKAKDSGSPIKDVGDDDRGIGYPGQ